ncbi:MAG: large-conductance mechanosensitive channel protein MscL [Oscillospiraceae bacterium]|nr:large-conductance mechanosensitive channel protein MscL [Oscillospiraceae bacterium]MBP1570408.1 large-conductance mechanosensitive channel protein MscL [Oscillospiraceae bacterium]MBQ5324613.1 large-conductance mechanosensitive channel protein MscL [Oscillospiraceae bacterium]
MKKFMDEFKAFISRGNVVDMAVGVIVGSAFTAIVNSLVKDVVTPFIGVLTGGVDFTQMKYVITPAVGETPEVAILYGNFIQAIINFLIIAFVVFCMVKMINSMRAKMEESKKKEEEAAPAEPPKPSEEVLLLTEIRDLLKKG